MKRDLLFLVSLIFIINIQTQAADSTSKIAQNNIKKPAIAQHIVLSWSKPDHPLYTHCYKPFADKISKTLDSIDNISTETVKGFPGKGVWKKADLVIFFLTQKALSTEQLELLDTHLKNGRSLLVFHQGLVLRQNYNDWADRIGFAFSWEKGKNKSKWGKFNNPIKLKNDHEILKGFPQEITFKDELYWNLCKGKKGTITVLGATEDPKGEGKEWPAFWTVQHPNSGNREGRVFGAVPGHFDKVVNSKDFETIIFRGISWCLNR
ncbi:MAG: ThuA domain-containing protein [Lentisphaeraceae bacterium]|nr:ThuA domain-containing protein [Lentisphaeraceae bacterium]